VFSSNKLLKLKYIHQRVLCASVSYGLGNTVYTMMMSLPKGEEMHQQERKSGEKHLQTI
jgi:hypothetical protein